MDLSTVKLVIWDLDETLWSGILSENTAIMSDSRIQLIHDMVDCGVMCSICSKNDHDVVKNYLTSKGIWDLFVFPSINWSPKGQRVAQIISEMNLRSVNVLFIDDNHSNRAEVGSANNNILVSDIDVIPEMIDYFSNRDKKDEKHTRLNQYKVLESKRDFRATVGSNEEFLKKCGIKVEIKRDCISQIERIHELILRSNQLNFTKKRDSIEVLKEIITDETIDSGYVEVKDNFGEYGIVGFFASRDNSLIHFVFSCRTLGMGVEQYVYKVLGCPEIKICGEVSSSLTEPNPYWINSDVQESEEKSNVNIGKIVFKGPCDMSQLFAYINCGNDVVTEFVYVNKNGVSIEQGNHSEHIVESITLSKEEKRKIIDSVPFGDEEMYSTSIFDNDVRAVVYSLFTDPNLAVYSDKVTGHKVAFGEYLNDLTDCRRWDDFINERVFTANCRLTEESLRCFSEKYTYEGRLSVNKIVENIDFIYRHLCPTASLILILGSEIPYENNTKESYNDRHEFNKELNSRIRQWSSDKNRVRLLDVNKYIESQQDFTNNINHFSRVVFYKMSMDLIDFFKEIGVNSVRQNGKLGQVWTELKRKANIFFSNPSATIKRKITYYKKKLEKRVMK